MSQDPRDALAVGRALCADGAGACADGAAICDENVAQCADGAVPCTESTTLCDESAVPCTDGAVPFDDSTVPCADGAVPFDDGAVPFDDGVVTCDENEAQCAKSAVPCVDDAVSCVDSAVQCADGAEFTAPAADIATAGTPAAPGDVHSGERHTDGPHPGRDDAQSAVVLKCVGGLFTVRLDDGEEVVCPARGRFRYEGEVPLPGDRVTLMREKNAWALSSILPRKNSLIRPAIANLTHLVAVIPACRPKPDTVTADKLICAAEDTSIEPLVVINKADLDPAGSARLADVYRRSSFRVFELSARSGEGVDALGEYLFSQAQGGAWPLVVFSGASGAGKSTLMSRLFPSLRLKTGDVSHKSERGRHTTRTAELFDVGGLFVADTPGFTMLDFAEFNFLPRENLAFSFREFVPYVGKCRYTKCTHTKEEGCAILEALGEGRICRERHANYVAIRAEMLKTPDWKKKKNRR